jgi:hypothetical protein
MNGVAASAPFSSSVADLMLLDIGINDVGFARWVEGLILDAPTDQLVGGFIPKLPSADGCDADCRRTGLLLSRVLYRFDVLRNVLDNRMLPDFGLAGARRANVIVPLYPDALQDASGAPCGTGNVGMTVATFPSDGVGEPGRCRSANGVTTHAPLDPFSPAGPVSAIRNASDLGSITWFREHELNKNLSDFSIRAGGTGPYDVVSEFFPRFDRRGFCASHDPASLKPDGECFTHDELQALDCIPAGVSTADSQHVPRQTVHIGSVTCDGIADFVPFGPARFYPYRSRTRLFRTQNDVYLLIDNRVTNDTDNHKEGILDLNGRTSSGAFHPTAEAHSIVANSASIEACKFLACER